MISRQGLCLLSRLAASALATAAIMAVWTCSGVYAQQATSPGHTANTPGEKSASSSASGGPTAATSTDKQAKTTGQTAPAAIMQIKRAVTGDLSYRFITGSDSSAAPVALPSPTGSDQVVSITIPSAVKPKAALLEVIDSTTGKVAHLPVSTSGVTPLAESDFDLVQSVFVPVQVKGKGGLYNATVTLSAGRYSKSWLLKPSDNGVAQFNNVPLGVPVTATVSAGGETPVSQTQTLPSNPPADGYHWQTILVDWPDAKAVAQPASPAALAPAANGAAPAASTSPAVPAPQPQPASDPLGWLVQFVVSLLFLGAICYGVFWAYKNGHLKRMLDNLGIQTQPVTAAGPQGSPFDKPARAPIQPITEGTADPLGGAGFAPAVGMAPVPSAGPRLVATMGAYAGNIFPLGGAAVDIGRDTVNPVALPQDTNASRRHATIQALNGQYAVIDNGSSNGTFVNGVRINSQTPHPLRPGDELQIGMTRFRFEA